MSRKRKTPTRPRPTQAQTPTTTPAQRLIARAQADLVIAPTKANLLATVEDLTHELARLEQERADYVSQARAAGASWAEVAARLGVTRQAAQMRFGR